MNAALKRPTMAKKVTKEEKIKELLNRGVDSVYPSKAAFAKELRSGRKLTVYLGIDPSADTLHIGNMVPLLKLRQFQDLGHQVILLVGDFTGQTGDPTDKQAVRQPLTPQQVKANAKKYQEQASTVLRFSGRNPAELKYNSTWLSKLTFAEVAELAGHFTVQQMVERDMFQERLKAEKPISLREFLYPLMQGYDSVAMEVDAEIGGTDQTFNMLAGRKLLKEYKRKEKFVLTLSLVTDAKGVKIGKTEGNAINITNPPEELFGQVMALPDEVVVPAFESATDVPQATVKEMARLAKTMPRDAKVELAKAIVTLYQGAAAAKQGAEHFRKVFQQKAVPDKVPAWKMPKATMPLWQVLKTSKLVASSSEAHRLAKQGGARVDGEQVFDPEAPVHRYDKPLVQAGKKKFIRVA